MKRPSFVRAGLGLAFVLVTACSAVYPEVATPARPPPAGKELTPPPPDDLYFIYFKGATIPATTRDGRRWDSVGGSAPDPFAKIMIGEKELLRTPIESNTMSPTWPDQKRSNYRIPKGTQVSIELWDSNPINNHPICVKLYRDFASEAKSGLLDIPCDSGARITLATEPAHARIGLGFRYEFRTQSIHVTRVVASSPAARMGIGPNDEITRIQGKDVSKIDDTEARDLINSNAPTGVTVTIRHVGGKTEDVTLKEGPVYPVGDDDIAVD